MKSARYLVAAALLAACTAVFAQGAWKPERNVEILVGASPGAGTDKTARMVQKLWQQEKMLDVPSIVSNRPGGGGAVSWAYLAQRQGDPHVLLVTSYNIVTNHITGKSKLTYTDFTPIALLISEYIAYTVKPDSQYRNLQDVLAALKKDPRAVAVGLSSSLGGANHIALGLLLKAAGVDASKVRIVVFNSGGESMTALLGGHVDMMVAAGSAVAPQAASRQVQPLAIAAPARIGGPFASVPTLKELGIPVEADNWRIVIAPKGISPQQVAFWDTAFKRLAQSEEWKKELASNHLSNNYLDSAHTRKYLDAQYTEVRDMLVELGLAKAAKP
jgi:putative tricarboxylic transport membrane protein